MSEPTTPNIGLIVPLTGDLPGAWGTAALNPNFSSLDGLFGGVLSLSFSSATTIALTTATGSITPSAGPFQSQNALIKTLGTLSGNIVVQFTQPGSYHVYNQCTVGNFYVQLAPSSGTGNAIGAPPGEMVKVFFDGTNMNYVDLGRIGSALDLQGVTAIPSWIASACTFPPYLLKDGSIYSTSAFPTLGAMLGSTFGGNGITTFGLPDERARARIAIDTNTNGSVTNRLTAAISGVNGTTMGASGGSQSMQSHNHVASDSGHAHTLTNLIPGTQIPFSNGGGQPNVWYISPGTGATNTGFANVTIATTGAGTSQNVQPTIVSFLPLIRAA
jgi:microcystin-dependent protein